MAEIIFSYVILSKKEKKSSFIREKKSRHK